MENEIQYYLDDDGGLWKKEGTGEFYFSRKELEWIKSQIVFILPSWDYDCAITTEAAEKILSDYKADGKWEEETIPFRYFANDTGSVFVKDILGNEFYVQDDMSLKPVPNGTVGCMWGGVSKIEAKSLIVGTLFELSHGFTLGDEDYYYDIKILSDGTLYVYQSKTYCYQPEHTIVQKEDSLDFRTEIIKILLKYRAETESITPPEGNANGRFNGQIFNKKFSYPSISNYSFVRKIAKEIKGKIEEFYPGEVDWGISISYGHDGI